MNAELGSVARLATSPFTVAQNAAYEAAEEAVEAAEAVRAQLPGVAVAAAGGMVIAALAGLWLLSKVTRLG